MTSNLPDPPNSDGGTDTPPSDQSIGPADRATNSTGWFRTVIIATLAAGAILIVALAFGVLGGDDPVDDAAASATAESGIFALPFSTPDGGTATLADYHGQPLVVNFFASWCPPCRAELPDFEAVHQKLGDDVTFVGINQDFTEESWKSFVAESQVTYDTVFQPQSEIWSELGTQAMPTTVFISADGEIKQVWAGLITDDKLEEVIDETLLEPAL